MNIKIGFKDSARALAFTTDEEKASVEERLRNALKNDEATVEFTDAKGRQFIVRQSSVAYVEIGAETNRPVGFAN